MAYAFSHAFIFFFSHLFMCVLYKHVEDFWELLLFLHCIDSTSTAQVLALQVYGTMPSFWPWSLKGSFPSPDALGK